MGTVLLIALGVFGFLGMLGMRLFVLHFRMPTNSMAPTICGGDHLLVNKLAGRPRRGDVVVFRTDEVVNITAGARGKIYIKRVVGLPGEQISFEPPRVLINGHPLTEPPILEKIQSAQDGFGGYVSPAIGPPPTNCHTLGPDEYFMLGDNSAHSYDSRYWGPIKRRAIIGRAVCIYWPLGRSGGIE